MSVACCLIPLPYHTVHLTLRTVHSGRTTNDSLTTVSSKTHRNQLIFTDGMCTLETDFAESCPHLYVSKNAQLGLGHSITLWVIWCRFTFVKIGKFSFCAMHLQNRYISLGDCLCYILVHSLTMVFMCPLSLFLIFFQRMTDCLQILLSTFQTQWYITRPLWSISSPHLSNMK